MARQQLIQVIPLHTAKGKRTMLLTIRLSDNAESDTTSRQAFTAPFEQRSEDGNNLVDDFNRVQTTATRLKNVNCMDEPVITTDVLTKLPSSNDTFRWFFNDDKRTLAYLGNRLLRAQRRLNPGGTPSSAAGSALEVMEKGERSKDESWCSHSTTDWYTTPKGIGQHDQSFSRTKTRNDQVRLNGFNIHINVLKRRNKFNTKAGKVRSIGYDWCERTDTTCRHATFIKPSLVAITTIIPSPQHWEEEQEEQISRQELKEEKSLQSFDYDLVDSDSEEETIHSPPMVLKPSNSNLESLQLTYVRRSGRNETRPLLKKIVPPSSIAPTATMACRSIVTNGDPTSS